MSEGLRQAGFDIQTAANHWPSALATHRLNHPDADHRSDNLSEVDWRTFPRTDLLAAAPSCVWHARAGGRKQLPREVELLRRDAGAIDRATAFAVIAAAEVHRYPVILVENVPEFRKWVLYQWWLDGLRALGYEVRTVVLNAEKFGNPSRRLRWFAVATLDGIHVDLAPPRLALVPASTILDDDLGKPVTRELYVAPQIAEIPEENVRYLVTYRNHAHARRADRHALATITAGGNHHAVAQLIDGRPWHRMLTDRECARAMGFPDSYRFVGKDGVPSETARDAVVKRQIGNAVPIGLGRWFGQRIAAALTTPSASEPADLLDLLTTAREVA